MWPISYPTSEQQCSGSDRFTNLQQSRCSSSVRALFKHKHLSILTMDSKLRQPFKPPSFSLTSVLSSIPTYKQTQQMQPFKLVILQVFFFYCYSTSLTAAVWKQFGDAVKWVCCMLYSMHKARLENKAWWPKSSHRCFSKSSWEALQWKQTLWGSLKSHGLVDDNWCKSSSLTGTNFQYHLEGDCSGSKERNVGIGKEHQQCKLKAVILKCTSAINTFIFQRASSLEI